jgi:hypothetical protein
MCLELAKHAETKKRGRKRNHQPADDVDFEPLAVRRQWFRCRLHGCWVFEPMNRIRCTHRTELMGGTRSRREKRRGNHEEMEPEAMAISPSWRIGFGSRPEFDGARQLSSREHARSAKMYCLLQSLVPAWRWHDIRETYRILQQEPRPVQGVATGTLRRLMARHVTARCLLRRSSS